jgi:hypothetical protein
MEKELILEVYPTIDNSIMKKIIKYQDKFFLTIENISCSNPNCNNLKKWHNTILGFAPTC